MPTIRHSFMGIAKGGCRTDCVEELAVGGVTA